MAADSDEQREAAKEAASRRRIAETYRAQRTGELKAIAEAALGGPVEAAARFETTAIGNLAMSIPFLGMLLAAGRSFGVPKPLRGLTMLALDGHTLYGIGSAKRRGDSEQVVLISWPRDAVCVRAIGVAGTDSAVTFEASSGKPTGFRLYCSSLRTNPWASELVRALGGQPPPPIDPTKLDYDATDLPTV